MSDTEEYILCRYPLNSAVGRSKKESKYTLHVINRKAMAIGVDPIYTFYVPERNAKRYNPYFTDRMSLLIYGVASGNLIKVVRSMGGDYYDQTLRTVNLTFKLLDDLFMYFIQDYMQGKYELDTIAIPEHIGVYLNGKPKRI